MQIVCPSCRHVLTVPPESAATPDLKATCRCGAVLDVATASRAAVAGASGLSGPAAVPRPTPLGQGRVRVAVAPAVRMAATPEELEPPPPPARPAAVPRPTTAHPASAAPAPPSPAPSNDRARPGSVPIPWRRCQNHPQTRSEQVCPQCEKGFCAACTREVRNIAVCPLCEGLCVAAGAYEQTQDTARQRARPMTEELRVIAAYPLADWRAFVTLALVAWVFSLTSGLVRLVLGNVVLTWYCFNAVSKVSIGKMREVMPDFRDVGGIVSGLLLSFAALAISGGPVVVCLWLVGDTSLMSAERDAPASMGAPLAALGLVLAGVWMIAYTPVALMVAARSKSLLKTVNPLIGVDTIKKMGSTYWQAVGVYAVLAVVQWMAAFALGLVPVAGGLARAFVDAYAALAIGCTLGLAVYKKAVALAWD
jgi:hypothetical protein